MEYDPIKYRLAKLLKGSHFLRRLFFLSLDLLFLRAWYVRRELKRLKKVLKHDAKFLDAGMGFGQYSDRLLRMFPDASLVGLEIDLKHTYGSVDYFRAVHPNSQLVLGDVQKIPLADTSFDFIITVDVMEHVDDDQATFKEYCRVLKPGGYLLMHTPRIRDDVPYEEHHHDEERTGWHVDEHVRDGYRDSEARERMGKAGLEVVRIVRGYGKAGMVAWNLLQRIPLATLSKSKMLLSPLVALYLIVVLPIALIFMWLDVIRGDSPRGGSLLVVAKKVEI